MRAKRDCEQVRFFRFVYPCMASLDMWSKMPMGLDKLCSPRDDPQLHPVCALPFSLLSADAFSSTNRRQSVS